MTTDKLRSVFQFYLDWITVKQWNEWFEATGDEESIKTWNIVKSIHRLDRITTYWTALKNKAPVESSTGA